MTADLAAFLRFLNDRLDDDEQAARAADAVDPAPWTADLYDGGTNQRGDQHGSGLLIAADGEALWDCEGAAVLCMSRPAAVHAARWDPARVLAEVAAKRRILELHDRFSQPQQMAKGRVWACGTCGSVDDSPTEWPCDTLRLLALPFAGHPDYRADWAPEG